MADLTAKLAIAAGKLSLQHFGNHALQHLSFKYVFVRQHGFLSLQHFRYAGGTFFQFPMGDDVIVNHDFNAVDGRALLLWRCSSGDDCRRDQEDR